MQLGSKQLTQEQIAQAYACKTPEELLELAKANGVELSSEEAQELFNTLSEEVPNEGELADAELENVAGGAGCPTRNDYDTVYFSRKEDVQFLFNIGDVVQAYVGTQFGGRTATVRIVDRTIRTTDDPSYYDSYKVKKISGSGIFGWEKRTRFAKR